MLKTRSALAVVVPVALAASLATAAPALAQGGNPKVIKTGACSMHSTWKLTAHKDNGRIEVDFEVDSNHVGQHWAWKLQDNGAVAASGVATTIAPDGSFEVRRLIANRAGTDNLRARAANAATGESCLAALAF